MSVRTGIVQLFEGRAVISSLTGTVGIRSADWVQIVVSGVGFRVEIPKSLQIASEEVTLQTSLIVREDSLTLFGFNTTEERDGFEVLMSVSGIGPRLALAAIDTVGLDDLRRGVASGDLTLLTRIPGVGKKTAQRMVLEIGDKLGLPADSALGNSCASTTTTALREPVAAALEQLGWPRAVAERTLNELSGEFTSVEEMLRGALGVLGAQRGF